MHIARPRRQMSRLEDVLSTIAVLMVALIVFSVCAYVRGVADGGSARLRGSCDVEHINQLKPGWYVELSR